METLAALANGFAVALTPFNLLWAVVGVTPGHGRRRAARDRPGADRRPAAAGHLQSRPDRRLHHVRRHLLRRHVRRLDHLDPAQHARRVGHHRDRARRQPDGAQGPRRPGAGDRGDRLVRRRHDRHARADLHRAAHGAVRAALQPGGLFRAHGAGLHHRHRGARQLARARPREPVLRPGARPGRHRHPVRPGALHARHPGAARRHRRDRGRGRPVRGRRDALRRQPLPLRAGGDHPGQGLDLDEPGGLGALVEGRGCAAPRSASRSARCRPAAPRSRPSSPT